MIYEYDYYIYLRQNCYLPLLFLIPSCVALLWESFSVWKDHSTFKSGDWVGAGFIFAICLFFIAIHIVPLANGGIHLLHENPSDAAEITGIIEETDDSHGFLSIKYDTEANQRRGQTILVNGKRYFLMSYYDAQPGDIVTLSVLPRSGFILRMVIVRTQ